MIIILNTGKGGVGKTSISAATALQCAKRGYKTLV
ncbi:anion-transporting ATPase [Serpentinicella alkaliphila]|uniref:Anion-transporting ATPase n=1 Tax=Serpentinicella alkaliphila TaxID=1734049 RepID=A0A4R2TWW6_9FIRM|nr:anion-transporting ATPase [Serpentinicella alkaliphila]